ncbi:MAG: hypothetical protein ACI82I_000957 [Gammaproteobacteria bacterium]|jgi:hypothetical protein
MDVIKKIGPVVCDGSPRLTERRYRKNMFKIETNSKGAVVEYIANGWTLDKDL